MKYLSMKSFWGMSVVALSISLGMVACASSQKSAEPESAPPASKAAVQVFSVQVTGSDKQVRTVEKATLAALDFAAYYANPIRMAGKEETPENYAGKMAQAKLEDYPFPMLESLSAAEPAAVAGVAAGLGAVLEDSLCANGGRFPFAGAEFRRGGQVG